MRVFKQTKPTWHIWENKKDFPLVSVATHFRITVAPWGRCAERICCCWCGRRVLLVQFQGWDVAKKKKKWRQIFFNQLSVLSKKKKKKGQKLVAHLKRLRVLCSSVRVLFPIRSSSCSVAGSESDSGTSFSSLQLKSTSCEPTTSRWATSPSRGPIKWQRRRIWPLFRASWGSRGRRWYG